MIRQLRAFAWLRWRLLLNGVRGSRRRDTLEQISRLLAMVAPALVVSMSLGTLLALSVAGWLAGYALARGGGDGDVSAIILRIVLVVQMVIVVTMPLGLSAQSAARNTRLLLLPVSRRLLHVIEVVSGLADPWVFVLVPGIVLLVAAVLLSGAWMLAAVAAAALVGFVAVLLSAGALVGFLSAWLMRDRRRAELTTILFVIALSLGGLLPQFLASDSLRSRRETRRAGGDPAEVSLRSMDASLPRWTRALPSEMAGRAVMFAARKDLSAAVTWTTAVWATAGVLLAASGAVHTRLLDAGDSRSRRRRGQELQGLAQVPVVPAGLSAVAMTQWRTGMRSVRGRLAVLLPGPIIALLTFVTTRTPEEAEWIARIPDYNHLVLGAAALFGLLAIHPFSLNQFTADRAGLTMQWLQPISQRDLVIGKALGIFFMYATSIALSVLVATLVTTGGNWWLWLAVVCAGCATYALMAPLAALLSAVFPVNADLNKSGSAGNPHTAAALIGMLCTALAAVPAVLIVLIVSRWSAGLAAAASAAWMAVAAGMAVPLLMAVARVVQARRENLFLTVRT